MKFITLSVTLIFLLSTLYSSSSHSIFEEIKSNKNVRKLQEKIDVLFDPFSEYKKPNPFKIDFPNQKDISSEEYLYIQEKLREIDILPLLQKLYPKKGKYGEFAGFKGRCSVGLNQRLINIEKDQIPIQKLEKIGSGGTHCILCTLRQ